MEKKRKSGGDTKVGAFASTRTEGFSMRATTSPRSPTTLSFLLHRSSLSLFLLLLLLDSTHRRSSPPGEKPLKRCRTRIRLVPSFSAFSFRTCVNHVTFLPSFLPSISVVICKQKKAEKIGFLLSLLLWYQSNNISIEPLSLDSIRVESLRKMKEIIYCTKDEEWSAKKKRKIT